MPRIEVITPRKLIPHSIEKTAGNFIAKKLLSSSQEIKPIELFGKGVRMPVGKIEMRHATPNVVGITQSRVYDKRLRGIGLGRKLLGNAIRSAYDEHVSFPGAAKHITSDTSGGTSEKAKQVWEALKRRGYPDVKNVVFATPNYVKQAGAKWKELLHAGDLSGKSLNRIWRASSPTRGPRFPQTVNAGDSVKALREAAQIPSTKANSLPLPKGGKMTGDINIPGLHQIPGLPAAPQPPPLQNKVLRDISTGLREPGPKSLLQVMQEVAPRQYAKKQNKAGRKIAKYLAKLSRKAPASAISSTPEERLHQFASLVDRGRLRKTHTVLGMPGNKELYPKEVFNINTPLLEQMKNLPPATANAHPGFKTVMAPRSGPIADHEVGHVLFENMSTRGRVDILKRLHTAVKRNPSLSKGFERAAYNDAEVKRFIAEAAPQIISGRGGSRRATRFNAQQAQYSKDLVTRPKSTLDGTVMAGHPLNTKVIPAIRHAQRVDPSGVDASIISQLTNNYNMKIGNDIAAAVGPMKKAGFIGETITHPASALSMPEESFVDRNTMGNKGGGSSFELISEKPIIANKIEEIQDALKYIEDQGVELKSYNPHGKSYESAVHRMKKRIANMNSTGRRQYLRWVKETNPELAKELQKTAADSVIVSGIHGDEPAGRLAGKQLANEGKTVVDILPRKLIPHSIEKTATRLSDMWRAGELSAGAAKRIGYKARTAAGAGLPSTKASRWKALQLKKQQYVQLPEGRNVGEHNVGEHNALVQPWLRKKMQQHSALHPEAITPHYDPLAKSKVRTSDTFAGYDIPAAEDKIFRGTKYIDPEGKRRVYSHDPKDPAASSTTPDVGFAEFRPLKNQMVVASGRALKAKSTVPGFTIDQQIAAAVSHERGHRHAMHEAPPYEVHNLNRRIWNAVGPLLSPAAKGKLHFNDEAVAEWYATHNNPDVAKLARKALKKENPEGYALVKKRSTERGYSKSLAAKLESVISQLHRDYSVPMKTAADTVIVSGIHGDEPASWKAGKQLANEGKTVVDVGNHSGKRDFKGKDLNRSFDDKHKPAKAALGLNKILEKKPKQIIDLHEDVDQTMAYAYASPEKALKARKVLRGNPFFSLSDKPVRSQPPKGSLEKAVERKGIGYITAEAPAKSAPLKKRISFLKDISDKLS